MGKEYIHDHLSDTAKSDLVAAQLIVPAILAGGSIGATGGTIGGPIYAARKFRKANLPILSRAGLFGMAGASHIAAARYGLAGSALAGVAALIGSRFLGKEDIDDIADTTEDAIKYVWDNAGDLPRLNKQAADNKLINFYEQTRDTDWSKAKDLSLADLRDHFLNNVDYEETYRAPVIGNAIAGAAGGIAYTGVKEYLKDSLFHKHDAATRQQFVENMMDHSPDWLRNLAGRVGNVVSGPDWKDLNYINAITLRDKPRNLFMGTARRLRQYGSGAYKGAIGSLLLGTVPWMLRDYVYNATDGGIDPGLLTDTYRNAGSTALGGVMGGTLGSLHGFRRSGVRGFGQGIAGIALGGLAGLAGSVLYNKARDNKMQLYKDVATGKLQKDVTSFADKSWNAITDFAHERLDDATATVKAPEANASYVNLIPAFLKSEPAKDEGLFAGLSTEDKVALGSLAALGVTGAGYGLSKYLAKD